MRQKLLLLAFLSIVFSSSAQKLRWDNSAYFKDKAKAPFLDWSDWSKTWDGKQIASWSLFLLSGVAHGIGEEYHKDTHIFERTYGVDPLSFWGSKAWMRNYYGNNPDNGHRPEWFGNVGRDVWHTANFVDSAPLILGTITITLRQKMPLKYRLANLGAGLIGRMGATQIIQAIYK